jgi:hypothetical protein
MWCYRTRPRHHILKRKRTRSPKAINGGIELEATLASDAAPLMAARLGSGGATFARRRPLNRRGAQETKWPRSLAGGPERKGEDTRELHGQSVATQTALKFGPRLRPRGHTDENTSNCWEHFFLSPVKIGPNQTAVICVGRKMPLSGSSSKLDPVMCLD